MYFTLNSPHLEIKTHEEKLNTILIVNVMGKWKNTIQINQHGMNVHHVPISNRAVTNKQRRVHCKCIAQEITVFSTSIKITRKRSMQCAEGRPLKAPCFTFIATTYYVPLSIHGSTALHDLLAFT